MLAMVASVEAIFLSTFILITQNRMAAAAHRRAELDPQVSPLAEAEITKLVELVSEIADRMNVPAAEQEDLEEMKRMVAPEAVLDAIEENRGRLDRLSLEWQSSVDCGRDVHRPGGKVFGKLGMPGAGLFGHCALCSHAFLDFPTAIVTLVGLHWSPLNSAQFRSITRNSLRDGEYPQDCG
ncbi:MAG TPA: DUF1003 domain-containing protein [Sphingomicrobium sp.]|nr:DUF1003 domain-containing protein [Sphingomicrobium sp.]